MSNQQISIDGFSFDRNSDRQSLSTENTLVKSMTSELNDIYDVIVVGAGFAGLICARNLRLSGYSVLLIEARDRIGGRTYTVEKDKHLYELGGTWIHWSQPFVWTEMQRYGLHIVESIGAIPDDVSYISDGKLKQCQANEILPQLSEAMSKYCTINDQPSILTYPYEENIKNDPILLQLDQMSLLDRFKQIKQTLSVEMQDLLLSFLSMNTHANLNEGGFLTQLHWWSLGDSELGRMLDKVSRYKVAEGTSHLANCIFNEANGIHLLLSTQVETIEHSNIVVINRKYKARTCIITAPMNVLANIEFIPKLKNHLFSNHAARHGGKFYAKIEGKIGRWLGFAPPPNLVTMAFSDYEENDSTWIVGFDSTGRLDISDIQSVQQALQTLLPNATVQSIIGHKWAQDPYAQGTWCWLRPTQMTCDMHLLRTHEEPLFFASGDYACGWRGFIDGAIESGVKASMKVKQYFTTKITTSI
ncbi:unnamed protein product [Didymodactylos carnosus]|uniref:Amine oxidase n=1 Tax=Didymodactylos carnosus TaxID=1234261 RepID=A0A814X950_9BILA|nr:unnamed protein product [Didymodactylos carnosus]CAF1294601.1 unnamed protein product [Didymodactylos carnosus]CAF3977035.1 unnamed protein product [Didymodactylos carnosus]CAF4099887.1 unnamed protein product [Didymodactylos carnosus]